MVDGVKAKIGFVSGGTEFDAALSIVFFRSSPKRSRSTFKGCNSTGNRFTRSRTRKKLFCAE